MELLPVSFQHKLGVVLILKSVLTGLFLRERNFFNLYLGDFSKSTILN